MPIKMLTPKPEIDAYIAERIEAMKEAVIRSLYVVGEQCVNHARNLPSPSAADFEGAIPPHQPNYMDWTGNLRSSIGYVIVNDGDVVTMSDFGKSGDGANSGKQYAEQLVAQFPTGIALIVVAGMKYAAYVTAKGYDVIDSAELLADKLVPQMLGQLGLS